MRTQIYKAVRTAIKQGVVDELANRIPLNSAT